jgi:hypothetical protein
MRSAMRKLAIFSRLRNAIYRACGTVAYACGVRSAEATALEKNAIDGVNHQLALELRRQVLGDVNGKTAPFPSTV